MERHLPRKMLVPLAAIGLVAWSGCGGPTSPAAGADATRTSDATATDPKAKFAGNWELVRVERIGTDGELLPPPDPPAFGSDGAIGYLMYDPAGYMGVVIMQPGRQPYAGDVPTPDEALAALRSYTSYFGTFSVDESEGSVTHHLQGNASPPGARRDNTRSYEFSGDQLTLEPPAGDSGVRLRIVWQRVPDLPDAELTATHRRLFGFYRIVDVSRRTVDGEVLPVDQYEAAFLMYMKSGHMAVHEMRPNRPTYAGMPSAEDALGAVTTYLSYFGPFSVHEDEGYLVHHKAGDLNPAQVGTDGRRPYELTDTTLTLRPPVRAIDGREVELALTWERIGNEQP